MITDTHNSLAEQAQQLSRRIPDQSHPDYRLSVHRWAQTLRRAIYEEHPIMTLPDLATRTIPTLHHDYSGTARRELNTEERLQQIEQRLENLEVLIRIQQDDLK